MGVARRGDEEYGFVEGQNLVFERRYAAGKLEVVPQLAMELVQSKVDVVMANSTSTTAALQKATSTIPIVMISVTDPVLAGLIPSLSRPGGNVTGVLLNTADITAKRIQILKEMVPTARRVGAFYPGEAAHTLVIKKWLQDTKAAGEALGISIVEVDLGFQPGRWEQVFKAARERGIEAAVVSDGPAYVINAGELGAAALKNRLPVSFGFRPQAEAGGLVSYGVDLSEVVLRAVAFVAKVLNGAKPADLPVEQPTKFELTVNMKTANALGIVVPASILARADKVIE